VGFQSLRGVKAGVGEGEFEPNHNLSWEGVFINLLNVIPVGSQVQQSVKILLEGSLVLCSQ